MTGIAAIGQLKARVRGTEAHKGTDGPVRGSEDPVARTCTKPLLIAPVPVTKEGKSAINQIFEGNFAKFAPGLFIYVGPVGRWPRKSFMLGRLAVSKALQILGKILT